MGMFDDALKNAGRSCIMRAGTVAFCIVFPLDVATVYFLREAPALIVPQGFNGSMANSTTMDMFTLAVEPFEVDDFQVSWRWKDLLENLDDFDGDTVDVCLLLVLRIFMLLVLLGIGSCATRKKTEGPCCYPCADQSPPAERVAPLLINQATPAEEAPALTQLSHQADHQHVAAYNSNQRIALKKNLLSALMFVCSTTAQVYLGIKVIGFHGLWEESGEASTYAARIKTVQGLLFFTSVLIINVETVVATRLLDAMGMEDGFDVPALHQHRLFFKVINSHLCDLCRNPVNEVYRCDTCDFDICPACFNKKDKATGEGVMRGDKGVRDAVKLGRLNYVWRCLRLIGPYSPSFIFAMVCLLMQSVASLIMPNFQGQLFDHVIDALHSCTADPYSKACHDHRDGFFQIMGFYAGLSASLGLLVALRTLAFQIVARQINFGTRKQLFARAMRADIAFFDGMRTGDIQTRLDRDVTAMVFPIRTSLSTILANLTLLIGGLILCFRTSWRLSMLAFTTILPMMHITATYAGWSRKLNQAMNQHISDAISRSGEAVNNIRTVRACSAEAFEIAHNDKTVNRALLSGIKDAIGAGVSAALNDYLELGAGVLILWYGGTMAMEPHGSITVGQLITYQLYWNIINTAVQALNDNITTFTRAAGSAERVLSLFDLTPDIDPDGGTHVEAAVTRWSIEFVDVEFHYQMRPNLKVLTGMSFAVPAGKVGALVGRSGGGKSTMIHLLLRFYDPRAGCIRLGGVDLREINIATMHHFVGVVSQETQMFNGTILESMRTEADALRLATSVTLLILCVRAPRLWTDLAYSIEDPSTEEIEEATKAAQCFDFIASFDDGLSTRVGERGQRLSGGQKQRIAIARCLLRKPRMLLLDEATSALDAESEAQVQKALDAMIWSGEKTVVLVAHRLSTVINSHTIIVVDKGQAAEQGNHDELLALQGTYASLVAYQLRKMNEQMNNDGPAAGANEIDALFDAQTGGGKVGGSSSSDMSVDDAMLKSYLTLGTNEHATAPPMPPTLVAKTPMAAAACGRLAFSGPVVAQPHVWRIGGLSTEEAAARAEAAMILGVSLGESPRVMKGGACPALAPPTKHHTRTLFSGQRIRTRDEVDGVDDEALTTRVRSMRDAIFGYGSNLNSVCMAKMVVDDLRELDP